MSSRRGTEWATLSLHGNGCVADQLGVVATQEKDHARDVSRLCHFAKSALGIALRFGSVSMMLGRIELARTPVSFRSAASESIIATATAFEAAYAAAEAA